MWAIVAAPLILGSDPRTLTPSTITMLENPELIAIDQDPLVRQGAPIQSEGSGQVWVKQLADGDRAVALLNRGREPVAIRTTASAIGLPAAPEYRLRNVWTHTSSTAGDSITALVPGDSAVLYRVSIAR
jgi:alpha-galactosidase